MDIKKSSGSYVKFFVYLVIVVLINIAGITLFYRVDLTENKAFSISEASKNVVATLSEPLTIKVFFTKDLPAPHNNTERYVHDLLEEYALAGNEYFNYYFYNVSADEGDISLAAEKNQKLAESYGIYPVQINLIEKDEIKFQKAYMGIVLIHGDLIEKIGAITSTSGLEYRLTTAIQKLNNKISALLSLPEKIKITLVLSSSLNIIAPYINLNNFNEIPKQTEEVIKKLNDKNYGQLEYKYIDPDKEQNIDPLLEKYNIMSLKWPELPDKKIKSGRGFIGLVLEYGAKELTIPLLNMFSVPIIGTTYELVDMNEMEQIIDENLESLININEDLGYLADHGTLKVPEGIQTNRDGSQAWNSITNFGILASQNYALNKFNLKDGDIPGSINCMVIAGPKETFTDYELFQIDQFLMKGKSLALFLDAFDEVSPQNQQSTSFGFNKRIDYIPLNTKLEKLLEHYGIRVNSSFVMDETCYKQELPQHLGGGEQAIYFAPLLKNRLINNELPFMRNIRELIVIKASPLELDQEVIDKEGLKAYRLLASSDKSWEMKQPINLNPMLIYPPDSDDERKSMPLAYILEGEFPSFFAGKPIPEKEVPEDDYVSEDDVKPQAVDATKVKGVREFISRGKPGKIFIMASTEMLKDNVLDAEGQSPNAAFAMNIIDYLNDREEIAVMRNKHRLFNPLNDVKAGTRAFVKSFNIAGLPVLVVLYGLFVWLKRRSRKKQIQIMFKK